MFCHLLQLASIKNFSMSNTLSFLYKKYIPALMELIFEGVVPAGGFGGPRTRKNKADAGKSLTSTPQVRVVLNHSGQIFLLIGVEDVHETGGGAGSATSSTNSKIIHVIPTSSMHTIVQFCALLSGQIEDGAPPGTDNPGQLPVMVTAEEDEEDDAVDSDGEEGPQHKEEDGEARRGIKETIGGQSVPPAAPPIAESSTANLDEISPLILDFENPDVLEAIFLHCLVWAFGAPMHLRDQITVDEAIKALSGLGMVDEGDGMPYVAPGVIPAHSPYLFDYMFDLEEFHWVQWRRLVPSYIHNVAVPYPEILVPTVETVKLEWILKEMFLVRMSLYAPMSLFLPN